MQLRSYKFFSIISVVVLIGSFLVMGQKEARFIHDPQAYDSRTGHTIPLVIRGAGTVYLTPAESQSLDPYVYAVYAAFASVFFVLGGRLIYQAYSGFMRGWRS